MNITFDNPDKVNGLLTITIEKEDYSETVEKTLKNYRKRANIPGFRPGMAPMSMIKHRFGTQVKLEEINKLLGEKLTEYFRENKIQMLGEPLSNEKQEPMDLATDGPFTFMFDIAVAPEFKAELTAKDKIDYYTIKIDDKLIDQQVQMYASQAGNFVEAQVCSGNDTLTGDLRQLDAEGNTLEGGITTDNGMIMPSYIKDEAQRKLFDGCKPGDIITFNPKKAYPGNDTEVAALLKIDKEQVKDLESDFSYQVTGIRHFQPAEVNQQLFDKVLGEGKVSSEKEFRQQIAEMLRPQLTSNSDYRFFADVRAYIEKKVGEIQLPEALLKRFLVQKNKEHGKEFVEKNFEANMRELKWHLIKEQLVEANQLKVEDADLKSIAREATRQQFAQYGMNDVPEDVIDQYAGEQLKKEENVQNYMERIIDHKLTLALKNVVKLNEKQVTLEEFNKMIRGDK